eukprot:TRINITY_DN4855_c0_g2_i1.p1 TRINITY_DN4855_c0_g2~~TRINITY_DN4855_c0_g2_i1.p1  ORF type:complete len:123 (-),score=3.80 TRINITY_DN4855_c0_g2_i1:635-1003(-)
MDWRNAHLTEKSSLAMQPFCANITKRSKATDVRLDLRNLRRKGTEDEEHSFFFSFSQTFLFFIPSLSSQAIISLLCLPIPFVLKKEEKNPVLGNKWMGKKGKKETKIKKQNNINGKSRNHFN